MSDLPTNYDVIIVGTGLTESILAAALSRIGKIVLHIDRNEFYGGEFSSHCLSNLLNWADNLKQQPQQTDTSQTNDEATSSTAEKQPTNDADSIDSVKCNNNLNRYYSDIEYSFDESHKEELIKQSRKFTVDLTPNILYSSGPLINLLISSDVGRYCEFKMVTQILTRRSDGHIEKVPTSRSEVFKSSQMSIIEKRVMMQFVQACLKDNNFADIIDAERARTISFKQLISEKKLPDSISNYLLNAVSMCADESKSAQHGLEETKRFLKSVGRFGDSPFLFCLYGSGELPQCFCRMSAVFGAVYYLTLTIDTFNTNKQTNLIESINAKSGSESFKFNCKHLIIDGSYSPEDYLQADSYKPESYISRCTLITDKSLFNSGSEEDHVSILYLPKTDNSPEIYLIEASPTVNCSPKGHYLVYMFCNKTHTTTKEDFAEWIGRLFNDKTTGQESSSDEARPNIQFSFFYSHLKSFEAIDSQQSTNKPSNLHILGGSVCQLDFDYQVKQAEKVFRLICPNEEFIPKPPDPEDIIIESSVTEEIADQNKRDVPASDQADKPDQDSSSPQDEPTPSTSS